MDTGRLDGLTDVEEWFRTQGYRLEFVLTNREGWAALIVPADGLAQVPFLSADAADPLEAALEARAAFLRSPAGR